MSELGPLTMRLAKRLNSLVRRGGGGLVSGQEESIAEASRLIRRASTAVDMVPFSRSNLPGIWRGGGGLCPLPGQILLSKWRQRQKNVSRLGRQFICRHV